MVVGTRDAATPPRFGPDFTVNIRIDRNLFRPMFTNLDNTTVILNTAQAFDPVYRVTARDNDTKVCGNNTFIPPKNEISKVRNKSTKPITTIN